MEKYYGLVIGKDVNIKHLNKTSTKFYNYFELATAEEKQDSIEIWLELHDLSPRTRSFYNVIDIQKKHLPRYIEIIKTNCYGNTFRNCLSSSNIILFRII